MADWFIQALIGWALVGWSLYKLRGDEEDRSCISEEQDRCGRSEEGTFKSTNTPVLLPEVNDMLPRKYINRKDATMRISNDYVAHGI